MRSPSTIKSSSDLIGKRIRICFESRNNDDDDANELLGVIVTMETEGILFRYYTEDEDSTQQCEKDEDNAVDTHTYVPWSKVRYIDYREDEKYPE